MKITTCIKHKFLLALLPLIGILSACNADWRQNTDKPDPNEEQLVTFSMKVPGGYQPKTYAITEADENEVSQVLVLLFDKDDKYTYQPVYSSEIKTDPYNLNIKTFSIKVPKGHYGTLMVLANANTDVLDALSNEADPIKKGDSKAKVISKLHVERASGWVDDKSESNYRPIPMWGEKNNINIDKGINDNISLDLIRALARIDVISDKSKTNLHLTRVYLYNYNEKGYIVPQTTSWETTPSVLNTKHLGAVLPPYKTVVVEGSRTSITNQIYTFEANRGTSEDHLINTCIVVGGKYKNDAKETFYRIDFMTTNAGNYVYLDLLRNHLYKVDIESVDGPGLPDPDEALKSRPVNITAKVTPWNEANLSEVESSGEHFIGVNKTKFVFTKDARKEDSSDNTLTISTDHPQGWNISRVIDIDSNQEILNTPDAWVRVKDTEHPAGTHETKILTTENNTGRTRRAKIHVTAGNRLSLVVNVEQSIEGGLSLVVNDEKGQPVANLDFESEIGKEPTPRHITAIWSPKSLNVKTTFWTASFPPKFEYANSSDKPLDGSIYNSPTGEKVLTIIPKTIPENDASPFVKRSASVTFNVTNLGKTVTHSIGFTHQAHGIIVKDLAGSYMLDGKKQEFKVHSSTGWRIKDIRTGSGKALNEFITAGNLKVGTGIDHANGLDNPIYFTTNGALNQNISETVYVTFESTEGKYKDKTVEFDLSKMYIPGPHRGWAGSNIYWDGTKLTFDAEPTLANQKKAGVYFLFGSLTGLDPSNAKDGWEAYNIMYQLEKNGSSYIYRANNNIPWVDQYDVISSTFPNDNTNQNERGFLYEVTNLDKNIGDICKALTVLGMAPESDKGVKWRMPTQKEILELGTYTYIPPIDGSIKVTDPSGQQKIDIIGKFTSPKLDYELVFPTTGQRVENGQSMTRWGGGFYWGSSLQSAPIINDPQGRWNTHASMFSILTQTFYARPAERRFSNNVRCVRE